MKDFLLEDEFIEIYLKLNKKTNFFLLSESVNNEDLNSISLINQNYIKFNIWTSFEHSKNISTSLLKDKNINLETFKNLNLKEILLKKEKDLGHVFFELGGKIFLNYLKNDIKYFDLLILTILNDNYMNKKNLTEDKFNQKEILKSYKLINEKSPIFFKKKIWQFQTYKS